MIITEGSLGNIDAIIIKSFEKKMMIRLPEEYYIFLVNNNGGYPDKEQFDIPGQGSTMIGMFYGICEGNEDDIYNVCKLLGRRRPANLLPIAYDQGGNQICLAVSGRTTGSIYFWDHELEGSKNPNQFVLLATSFLEFINSVY